MLCLFCLISLLSGKYVGNRPIKLRKSNWKERTDVEALQRQKVYALFPFLSQVCVSLLVRSNFLYISHLSEPYSEETQDGQEGNSSQVKLYWDPPVEKDCKSLPWLHDSFRWKNIDSPCSCFPKPPDSCYSGWWLCGRPSNKIYETIEAVARTFLIFIFIMSRSLFIDEFRWFWLVLNVFEWTGFCHGAGSAYKSISSLTLK